MVTWGDGRRLAAANYRCSERYGHTRVGADAGVQRGRQPGELVPQVAAVLDRAGESYEIVVVDDGSTDGTRGVMQGLRSPTVRYIRLRRNAGKSAGAEPRPRARAGRVHRPHGRRRPGRPRGGAPAPRTTSRPSGLDLVTGRRAVRNDRFVKRTTSKLYNGVTAKVTGVPGKDFNSGLKAMTPRARRHARDVRRAAPVHPGAGRVERLPRRRARRRAPRAPPRHARSSGGPASGGASSTS